MHTAPLAERIEFVRYKVAELHLAYASAAIELADRADEFRDTIFFRETVWTAFFVNYGKPFKQSRDTKKGFAMRLPEDVVPPEHLVTHRSILMMRDKHFAHTDLDFQSCPLVSTPEELLVVLATRAGLTYGIGSLVPADSTVADYKATLDAIMDKVAYRADKIANRWSRHLRVPINSMWTVNLSKTNDAILSRIVRQQNGNNNAS
jgi:hypothetical protein